LLNEFINKIRDENFDMTFLIQKYKMITI